MTHEGGCPKASRFSRDPSFGRFEAGHSGPLMAMIEVTNRCNMSCPVCFSDANNPDADVPMAQIRRCMERLLEVSGQPIPLQISGGEPTMRKDLPEIIALARNLGFRHIELVTNGVRIAQEEGVYCFCAFNDLHRFRRRGSERIPPSPQQAFVYTRFDTIGRGFSLIEKAIGNKP